METEATCAGLAEVSAVEACPKAPTADLLYSRWTPPILWTLAVSGRQRFSEIQRSIPMITPKVLTQRLRQLERDGLVTRTYYPEVPPRVEYEITALGQSLAPLFAHLTQWALANLQTVNDARRRFDELPLPGRKQT